MPTVRQTGRSRQDDLITEDRRFGTGHCLPAQERHVCPGLSGLPTDLFAASLRGSVAGVMTNVGVYVLLRLWLLAVGERGVAEPGFGYLRCCLGRYDSRVLRAAGMLSNRSSRTHAPVRRQSSLTDVARRCGPGQAGAAGLGLYSCQLGPVAVGRT